jgi:arylsulfatase
VASVPRLAQWDSDTDAWELYDLNEDFSQADDLAARMPEKLRRMKKDFLALAEDNKDFPIGAGNWLRLHPEDRIKTHYKSWTFNESTRRMPEFTAPGLGRESNRVEISLEVPAKASGVLYALGGAGGGITLYMDQGHLVYLYNMMIIEQYTARSAAPIASGKRRIAVITHVAAPGREGVVTLLVDGKEVSKVELKRTVPAAFSASETLDVGVDLGSTVSLDYFDKRPFPFTGRIHGVKVDLQ